MTRRAFTAAVIVVLSCVTGAGCRRTDPPKPPSSTSTPTPPPAAGPHAVLKTWKGHVDAVDMNIAMLWFSPRASVRSDAVKAEAKQVVEEGAAFLASPPTLDAVIVKATASVGTSIMNLSHTESFVFAKNSKGVWEYTEKYDEQFAKLGL